MSSNTPARVAIFARAGFSADVTVRLRDDGEQGALEIDATRPVFEIWHVAYTDEDRPVEVCVHVMPGAPWTLRYGWDDGPVPGPSA